MELKTSPHCQETEATILGSLLNTSGQIDGIPQAHDLLSPECFYLPAHRDLYRALHTLWTENTPPDIHLLVRQLEKQGSPVDYLFLSGIIGKTTFQLPKYVQVALELYQRRQLAAIALGLYQECHNELNDIHQLLNNTRDSLNHISHGFAPESSTLDEAIDQIRKRVEHNLHNESSLTGTPTGFHHLDQQSGGLQGSNLIIIAADTSQGKTALATKFVLEALWTQAPCAYYSLEMKKEELAARLIAMQSGLSASNLLYGKLQLPQIEQMERGLSRLYGLPLYFDDRTGSNLDTIIASIRTLTNRYHLRGVVIDYLQILNINMKESNKETQMAEAARRLKNLAHELNIWIIALSQLSRDTSKNVIGRLRDSGQIGEAADIVIAIDRPEAYGKHYTAPFQDVDPKGTARIDIVKGRNIGLQQFICGFEATTTRFYELDQVPHLTHTTTDPF
ncbi:MAG: AAA family ATPase [Tannerellaceae bacterium]|nr:AAA family ATPase [Tannerellaceae bacterium]